MNKKTLLAVAIALIGASAAAEKPIIYQLQPVDREQPIADGAQGLSVRVRWKTVEPELGRYDFRYIDRQQQRAKQAGIVWRLRIMAGWSCPAHAYRYSVTDTSRGQTLTLPIPWQTTQKQRHRELQRNLAARYAADPTLRHVDVPGFWRSAEMHIPRTFERHPRFTPQRMAHAYVVRINHLLAFWPNQTVVLNHSPEKQWGQLVRDHARRRGVAIQMNSLHAGTNTRWEGFTVVRDWTGKRGFQMVGPSSNQERFGGTIEAALQLGGTDCQWYEMYRGDIQAAAAWLESAP